MLPENIVPILIPTPFAVGDVYCYLIDDEKKVLVDCGHYAEEALSLVTNTLGERGLSVDDLDEIWLTHGHPDHFGLANSLSVRSGAVVKGHPKERSNFAGNDDRDLFARFFAKHRVPDNQVKMMVGQLEWLLQYQEPVEPDRIRPGDLLPTGQSAFTVHHTPGHAPGHVVFQSDDGIIFGGDLLLEKVSTNALINFDPETGERNKSLLQYRRSLEWIRDQQGMVLPGHGDFIRDIEQVAGHHLQQHQERYLKIKKLIDRRPLSLFELAQTVFPDALDRQAAFLVLSEIIGYLDWGMEEGEIVRERSKEGIRYSVQ